MGALELGHRTISRRGQLSPPVTFELGGVDEPVVWATVDDTAMAVLSRTRDLVDTHSQLSVAGTSIPDAAGDIAVPRPVFERVAGIAPGATVVFVATPELREQGAVGVAEQRLAAREPERLTPLETLDRGGDS